MHHCIHPTDPQDIISRITPDRWQQCVAAKSQADELTRRQIAADMANLVGLSRQQVRSRLRQLAKVYKAREEEILAALPADVRATVEAVADALSGSSPRLQ